MDAGAELGKIRERIDELDARLLPLFEERMLIAERVAKIKMEHGLPVLDSVREQQVIDRAASLVREDLRGEASAFMRAIMAISRERQEKILNDGK